MTLAAAAWTGSLLQAFRPSAFWRSTLVVPLRKTVETVSPPVRFSNAQGAVSGSEYAALLSRMLGGQAQVLSKL